MTYLVQSARMESAREAWMRRASLTATQTLSEVHAMAKADRTTYIRPDGSISWAHKLPEYSSWEGMKQRCFNPKMRSYAHYGGRGITVCQAWLDSFDTFYRDMGPRPSSKHSLDRIDNDKGYEPGNCRWATKGEQRRNRRGTRFIEYNGERLVTTDWAARLGLTYACLKYRLEKWPIEKAFTEPYGRHWRKRA